MMSWWSIDVCWAMSSIVMSPSGWWARIMSTMISAQYARYEMRPRSLSGFSGEPSLFSFFESSYENSIRSRPKPCFWYLRRQST